MIPASAVVLAPVRSLGLVLAGCPDCRAVVGIDGAPGLAEALAAHHAACPATDQVCPGCGCEAELHRHGDGGWRCGDCLGQRLFDDLASPPTPTRPRVRAVRARLRRADRQDAAEPVKRAVA